LLLQADKNAIVQMAITAVVSLNTCFIFLFFVY